MKNKLNGETSQNGGNGKDVINLKKDQDPSVSKKTKFSLSCDKFCPKFGSVEIFCESSNGDPYACTLNQTNIAQNNNKFFVIQVLKDTKTDHYYTWIRWGRVGYHGQTALNDCGGDVERAISIFEKKFSDKTKNNWSERHDFVKVAGKYDLVGTDFGDNSEEEDEVDYNIANDIDNRKQDGQKGEKSKETSAKKKSQASDNNSGGPSNGKENKRSGSKANSNLDVAECTLEIAVQDLIRMICDVKTMEAAAADIEFDTKRTPLGKISTEQIKLGYATLSQIASILKDEKRIAVSKSRKLPTNNRRKLTELSSEFYTRIPHCTGMRAPPVINSPDLLECKIHMLEVLGDIKLGMDLLRMSSKVNKENEHVVKHHPIDRIYRNLECDIKSLSNETEEFSLLEQYIMSTHATTHSGYTMEVQEVKYKK